MSLSSVTIADGQTDERTSFVRTAKSQRKYGSTSCNKNEPTPKYHPTSFMQHAVQPGDTLQGIALRYQTTTEYIKRINKMWTNDNLFLREHLTVPSPNNVYDADFGSNGNCSIPTTIIPESLTITKTTNKIERSKTLSPVSSPNSEDCERTAKDYLGLIDDKIKEAKSRAETLQKISEVLKNHPEISSQSSWPRTQASSRLRLSLSDLGGEFNAATNSTEQCPTATVVSGGRRLKSSHSYSSRRSQDEIFEL